MGQGQSEELQLQPLGDKYSIGRTKFGEGAYGTVWKGTDRISGNIVAIKQMSKAKLSKGGDKLVNNMGREVVMMRACQHENVAQLFGVFQEQKFVYLVMECCEGGDIGERVIGGNAQVSEDQLADWCWQMCSAAAMLHSKRICHRDLKPQNYLLRGSTLKLSDFGLAVFVPEGGTLSERCGTPAFMSPELHLLPRRSRGYSFPADAWALGLCIYMLVCRSHPFLDSRGFVDESSLLSARMTFGEDDSSLGMFLQSLNMGEKVTGPGSSPELRTLVSQLVCVDESKRLSAAQAMQSSWLTRRGSAQATEEATRQSSKSSARPELARRHSESAAVGAGQLPPPPCAPSGTSSWPLASANGPNVPRNRLQLPRSQSLQGARIPESTVALGPRPFAAKDLPNLLEHQPAINNKMTVNALGPAGSTPLSARQGYQ